MNEKRPGAMISPLGTDLSGVAYPDVFVTVGNFLGMVMNNEVKYGNKEKLTEWKNHAAGFKTKFLDEYLRYARRQYPYNQPVQALGNTVSWWKALAGLEFAEILPVSFFLLIFHSIH